MIDGQGTNFSPNEFESKITVMEEKTIEQQKDEFARAKGFANWSVVWQHFKSYEKYSEIEDEMIKFVNSNSRPAPLTAEEVSCMKAALEKYERFCVDTLNSSVQLHPGTRVRLGKRREMSDILWKRLAGVQSSGNADEILPGSSADSSLLPRAISIIDDFLNAGCDNNGRGEMLKKARTIFEEYHGSPYMDRSERQAVK